MKPIEATNIGNPSSRGFSLFEVLLSLTLVALLMMELHQTLSHLIQRNHWWHMLNGMVVSQQVAHKTLTKLHEKVCQNGLLQAQTDHWRLKLNQDDNCIIYDIRFGHHNGQWQKRRYQGRYASFLANTLLLQASYGVAVAGECSPRYWLTQVDESEVTNVVMIKLRIATGVVSQNQLSALPAQWFGRTPTHALATGEHWYWHPLHMVISLPCSSLP